MEVADPLQGEVGLEYEDLAAPLYDYLSEYQTNAFYDQAFPADLTPPKSFTYSNPGSLASGSSTQGLSPPPLEGVEGEGGYGEAEAAFPMVAHRGEQGEEQEFLVARAKEEQEFLVARAKEEQQQLMMAKYQQEASYGHLLQAYSKPMKQEPVQEQDFAVGGEVAVRKEEYGVVGRGEDYGVGSEVAVRKEEYGVVERGEEYGVGRGEEYGVGRKDEYGAPTVNIQHHHSTNIHYTIHAPQYPANQYGLLRPGGEAHHNNYNNANLYHNTRTNANMPSSELQVQQQYYDQQEFKYQQYEDPGSQPYPSPPLEQQPYQAYDSTVDAAMNQMYQSAMHRGYQQPANTNIKKEKMSKWKEKVRFIAIITFTMKLSILAISTTTTTSATRWRSLATCAWCAATAPPAGTITCRPARAARASSGVRSPSGWSTSASTAATASSWSPTGSAARPAGSQSASRWA